jgi:hypothetical protein
VQGSSGNGSNANQVGSSAVPQSFPNLVPQVESLSASEVGPFAVSQLSPYLVPRAESSSHRMSAKDELLRKSFFPDLPPQQSEMFSWQEESCFVSTEKPGDEGTMRMPLVPPEPNPGSLDVFKPTSTGTSFESAHSPISTNARLPGILMGKSGEGTAGETPRIPQTLEPGLESLDAFEQIRTSDSSLEFEIAALDSLSIPVKQRDGTGLFEGDLTPLSSPNNSPRSSPLPLQSHLPNSNEINPSEPLDDGKNHLTEPMQTGPQTSLSEALSSPAPAPASLPASRLPRPRPFIITPPRPEPIDLLTDVIGKQVHQDAQTVTWGCKWKTILPTKIKNGVNMLHAVCCLFYALTRSLTIPQDSQRVQWMADPRNFVPADQSRIRYLDRSAYRRVSELVDDIAELNARNYIVVVPGATNGQGLNAEAFEDLKEFGMSVGPDMKLPFIGMILLSQIPVSTHPFRRFSSKSDNGKGLSLREKCPRIL